MTKKSLEKLISSIQRAIDLAKLAKTFLEPAASKENSCEPKQKLVYIIKLAYVKDSIKSMEDLKKLLEALLPDLL
jgi:hypothetical protein